jgi:hypothetical protein
LPPCRSGDWCCSGLTATPKRFLILSLAFFAYPAAAILGHPDWKDVATNLVIPHFDFSRDFLLLAESPEMPGRLLLGGKRCGSISDSTAFLINVDTPDGRHTG